MARNRKPRKAKFKRAHDTYYGDVPMDEAEKLWLERNEAYREIERLRALKTPASRQLINLTKAMLDNAEEECAQLRKALSKIRGCADWFTATKIACKALADEQWLADEQ